jgi:hypothetical protein
MSGSIGLSRDAFRITDVADVRQISFEKAGGKSGHDEAGRIVHT